MLDGLHAWLRAAAPLLAELGQDDPQRPAAVARYQQREHLARLLDLEQQLLEMEAQHTGGPAPAYAALLRQYEQLARQGGEAGHRKGAGA